MGEVVSANGMEHRVILIAGPTASGKSALALELARELGRTIINADSMQIYDGLRLVTARPDEADEAIAPHRLYGTVDPATAFSTGDWLRIVAPLIEEAKSEGPAPILVGGTGLYYKALTEGFAQIPEIDAAIRAECRDLADTGGIEAVRSALAPLDAAAAAELDDLQRLTRALEVIKATGKSLSHWQSESHAAPLLPLSNTLPIVLAPPRPWLHDRIAQRSALMTGSAGQNEVASFLERRLDPTLPAMRAIGVKEISSLLKDECDEAEARERLVTATRQYAKRQETWFRNQMSHWRRIDPAHFNTRISLSNVFIDAATH